MSTIVTRAGKGSPLTHTEVDNNFTNLNTDKVEASGGTLTNPSIAGVASFADGSAAAPAITNTGDTNTGIFFPAADTIAFSEGGTEAMRLDASGNLGIGTSSVTTAFNKGLQVYQPTTGNAGLRVNAGSTTGFDFIQDQTGASFIYNRDNSYTAFGTNNTERMRLDSSGNLGLGVTPSAWGGDYKAFQITGGRTGALWTSLSKRFVLSNNMYVNSSGNDTYVASDYASRYDQIDGQHQWRTAPSGTAGNAITFTQAMTLDASGNLLVGTTSARDAGGTRSLAINGVGVAASLDLSCTSDGGRSYAIYTSASPNNGLQFYDLTASAERMRIDSSGSLLVGRTASGLNNTSGVTLWNSNIGFQSEGNEAQIYVNRTTSDGSISVFRRNNTTVGSISVTTSATAYNTSSDYRLKDNQSPLSGSGAFIDALQPKTWTWTTDGSAGIGFIAHEVQAVSPNSVVGEKDAVDEEGNPVMQAMEYGSAEFIANIIAELQDLRKRVSALENK